MFGTSHLYVFVNPEDAAKTKETKEDEEITYELAQKEIAKNSGIDVRTKSSAIGSTETTKEDEKETLGKFIT